MSYNFSYFYIIGLNTHTYCNSLNIYNIISFYIMQILSLIVISVHMLLYILQKQLLVVKTQKHMYSNVSLPYTLISSIDLWAWIL